MENLRTYAISIYILLSFLAFYKWYQYSKDKKIRDLVSYSAIGDYCPVIGCYSYINDLIFHVKNALFDDDIDKQYRLSEGKEEKYLREIVEAYQIDIMRSYFQGVNTLIKSKYSKDKNVYFLIMLHDYLAAHSDDFEFLNRNMRNYDGILSDFGIAYYKIYYATFIYCKKSIFTNPSRSQSWYSWEENGIKDALNSSIIH